MFIFEGETFDLGRRNFSFWDGTFFLKESAWTLLRRNVSFGRRKFGFGGRTFDRIGSTLNVKRRTADFGTGGVEGRRATPATEAAEPQLVVRCSVRARE
jgi:hypothetical protein